MKRSEAKIIIYINQVDKPLKYATKMAAKLNMDYLYIIRVLQSMHEKNWIKKIRAVKGRKIFYELTESGKNQIEPAILRMSIQ